MTACVSLQASVLIIYFCTLSMRKPLYQAYTNLVRNTDSSITGINYIQVARINNCEYDNTLKADLITRTFIWIIENGKISFSQAQLNAAKQALLPLWEESRFEMRYVYTNR